MKKTNIYAALFIGGTLLLSMIGTYFYQIFYAPNWVLSAERVSVYVRSGDKLQDLAKEWRKKFVLEDEVSFLFVAKALKYNDNPKPGHYVVNKRMSNIEVVRMLRSGAQIPIRMTFNNGRTKEDLAKKIAPFLILEEEELLEKLYDNEYLSQYGVDSLTVPALFLPNTYEMYWTTDADGLFKRMKREYDRFWTDARKAKAEEIDLTPLEVSTLASIVQAETQMSDEKPRVAGVYLNRLKRGGRLEADPTLVFANQDFTIKRVLDKHKAKDSPYNTYMYAGLPPGPINVPSPNSINAVLNYEKHKYLFFCAKADFSGYHSFARTYTQHLRNASKYHDALNARGIR